MEFEMELEMANLMVMEMNLELAQELIHQMAMGSVLESVLAMKPRQLLI